MSIILIHPILLKVHPDIFQPQLVLAKAGPFSTPSLLKH